MKMSRILLSCGIFLQCMQAALASDEANLVPPSPPVLFYPQVHAHGEEICLGTVRSQLDIYRHLRARLEADPDLAIFSEEAYFDGSQSYEAYVQENCAMVLYYLWGETWDVVPDALRAQLEIRVSTVPAEEADRIRNIVTQLHECEAKDELDDYLQVLMDAPLSSHVLPTEMLALLESLTYPTFYPSSFGLCAPKNGDLFLRFLRKEIPKRFPFHLYADYAKDDYKSQKALHLMAQKGAVSVLMAHGLAKNVQPTEEIAISQTNIEAAMHDADAYFLAHEAREHSVVQRIRAYQEKNPGKPVALVYGVAHDFSKYMPLEVQLEPWHKPSATEWRETIEELRQANLAEEEEKRQAAARAL